MKRDFKIWMVLLGIVAAGIGMTSFTRSYVSSKRIQITATAEGRAMPTEAGQVPDMPETKSALTAGTVLSDTEAKVWDTLTEEEAILAEQEDTAVEDTTKTATLIKEADIVEDYHARLEAFQTRLPELDAQIERMRSTDTDNTIQSIKSTVRTEQRIWERELDAVYTLLIGSLDENLSNALREEQQQWIRQRDSTAQEASKKSSGSMESVEYIASITASTRARVYQLVEEYQEP